MLIILYHLQKKQINVLRKLKYQLSRANLEKLYIVFIRPMLEYASEVWDNCGTLNASKLEQLQLEAARIVTGLPVFASASKVYSELGWEKLNIRREKRKLNMFYNIQKEQKPDFMYKLIPPKIQSTTTYPLRNGNDFIIPFCRLSLTMNSYIPSTIRLWNNLELEMRQSGSASKFKRELQMSYSNDLSIPNYFSYGPRKLNIILTQLRCCASF